MKWPTQKKVGVAIVTMGVAPLLTMIVLVLTYSSTPLDTPIQLNPGEFRSPEFKPDSERQYFLSLVGDSVVTQSLTGPTRADLRKKWCMMGVYGSPAPLNCDGIPQSVDFKWQIVSRQGRVLESGSYKPIGFGNLSVQFAEFQALGKVPQRVILMIRRDGLDLNDSHLRLKVEATSESDFPLAAPYLFFMSLAWAVILVTAGVLVIWLRRMPSEPGGE
jgi:hypothetical protein